MSVLLELDGARDATSPQCARRALTVSLGAQTSPHGALGARGPAMAAAAAAELAVRVVAIPMATQHDFLDKAFRFAPFPVEDRRSRQMVKEDDNDGERRLTIVNNFTTVKQQDDDGGRRR